MTERRAYTSEQWRALVDAAPAIARAVASVAGSQGQVETELGAFIALVDQAAADAPGGLLGAVAGRSLERDALHHLGQAQPLLKKRLALLHVKPATIKPDTSYKVDVKTATLIERGG